MRKSWSNGWSGRSPVTHNRCRSCLPSSRPCSCKLYQVTSPATSHTAATPTRLFESNGEFQKAASQCPALDASIQWHEEKVWHELSCHGVACHPCIDRNGRGRRCESPGPTGDLVASPRRTTVAEAASPAVVHTAAYPTKSRPQRPRIQLQPLPDYSNQTASF